MENYSNIYMYMYAKETRPNITQTVYTYLHRVEQPQSARLFHLSLETVVVNTAGKVEN